MLSTSGTPAGRSAFLALAAAVTWAAFPLAAAAQTEDVVFRNAVGVSVSGNDLTKTAAAGWGNSGAVSVQTLESNGFVEFSASGTAMLGLSMGDTDQNYPDLDFAIFASAGTLQVYEGGSSKGSFGAFAPSDKLRVEVANGLVRYRKNGVVLYTSTIAARFPLLVDSALNTTGSTLTDARIGQTSMAADAGLTFSEGTLTKTAASGSWNAGAVSARRIPWRDGYAEFSAVETNKLRAAGLSNGDTDKTAADIDFAILLRADATVEVQEVGVSRGTFGAYVFGDRFRVQVQSGVVTYLKNGTAFYTSAAAPVFPLWADTAFYDTGATLSDLVVAEINWKTASGVAISGGSLAKVGSAGWTAGAASTASLASGDGFVEFTASETNTTRACGLADQDLSYDPAEIDFAIQLQNNGDVRVYESGTLRGTFGTYAVGDRFRVEIQFGVVKYRKNGVVFYTSGVAPVYPLSVDTALDTTGATLREVRLGKLVFRNDLGVSVWGYSLLDTAATGWGNSGASSTVELVSGDGWVEYTATETTTWRMLGLSKGDADRNYGEIDFAIFASAGIVQVYQNGSSIGTYGAYAVGDRLRIAVEGGVVKYRKNGALLYTSSQAIQYPLLVDTALYHNGTAITDISVSPNFTQSVLIVPPLVFSLGSGTYNTAQTVTVTCGLAGTEAHYTTNGVDPTQSDPTVACGGTVSVGQSMTLKARGWKTGYTPSVVTSAVYTMVVGTPSFSPPPAAYTGIQSVALSTVTAGATIRYTTNGVDPGPSDPSGTSALVDHTLVLKAQASKAGWTDSSLTWGTYIITVGTVATPTLSPAGGSYSGAQTVTMSCATSGALIRYTVDGSDPTFASPLYTAPVAVGVTTTLKAKAFKADYSPSAVGAGIYNLDGAAVATPTFSLAGGGYAKSVSVTISTSTAGATIRYTTTGIDPTTSDATIASGSSLLIDHALMLKAKAFKAGMTDSGVRTASYWIVGAIGSGQNHTLVVKADGSVWATGYNYYGQLGDGTTAQKLSPVQVSGLSNVIAVSASSTATHSLAIKSDGSVWAFGNNTYGQLGDASQTNRSTPVQVVGLSGVTAVAAGLCHSLALKGDGTLWSWGCNTNGQLGDSTPNQRLTPAQVPGLSGITAIAAGEKHSLALKTDGTLSGALWAWGSDVNGQIGDGVTTFGRYSPVLGMSGIVAIAAGDNHSLAAKNDGSAWAWGFNNNGQLGDGTTLQRLSPVQVSNVRHATAMSAGTNHGLDLETTSTVWAWGANTTGQLGDGTNTARPTPAVIQTLSRIVAIASGGTHSLALGWDGKVWLWGYGTNGQLGDGTTASRNLPYALAFQTADNSWLTADPDKDGLIDRDEVKYGCDPMKADTNGDTLQDGPAIAAGLSCNNPDMDGDSVPNATEVTKGTDPFRADTDGDGANDGVDCFPLDPTRSQCPAPTPGDTTPPVITLTEPTSATLISSIPP